MRDIARNLLQAHHQPLNTIEHCIETHGEMIKFIVGTAKTNTAAKITGNNLLARLGDCFDTSEQTEAHEDSANQSQNDCARKPPEECAQDHLTHLVKLVTIKTDKEITAILYAHAPTAHGIVSERKATTIFSRGPIVQTDDRGYRRHITRQNMRVFVLKKIIDAGGRVLRILRYCSAQRLNARSTRTTLDLGHLVGDRLVNLRCHVAGAVPEHGSEQNEDRTAK